MWIETTGPQVVRVNPPCIDDPVKFNGSHTAQVTQDVGESLIDRYDFIIKHE